MNTAETIQAAIDRLSFLRADSVTGAHWKALGGLIEGEGAEYRIIVADDVDDTDADLIVTLHRTVDAQLVILRTGLPDSREAFSEAGQAYRAAAEILAKAILGGDS